MKELKKNVVFMLTQRPSKVQPFFPPTVTLSGMSKVIDAETGRERLAVYNPAASTIWDDEMQLPKDKEYPTYKNIKFVNGFRTISPNEQLLLKFLRVCGQNEANDETRLQNAVVFRELNKETKAAETFDDIRLLDNARYFVSNSEIKEVRAYALALAKNSGEIAQVQQMSEYELRLHLRFKAEKNPVSFIENMKDQVLINKVKVIQAIYSDVIVHNERDNTLLWKDGNEFLVPPVGVNAIQYLADMSTKNEKYANILKDIEAMMKGEAKPLLQKQSIIKQNAAPKEEGSEYDKIIDNAIESGIIDVSANRVWHSYKKGSLEERKFKGRAELITELETDSKFKAELEM